MSRNPRPPIKAKDIQGLKYLRAFQDLLAPLADRPVHGNRQFFMDEYVALLLLHFFNPVLGSLRALQQATGLENVQEAIGVKRTSLGAMSESAGRVFDPELMVPILETVMARLKPLKPDSRLDNLPGVPVAVDGSFLRCLPKMVWAVFRTQSDNRGARLHLQFDILRGAPVGADITEALGSEKKMLRKKLKAGLLYLMDRGFVDYSLFQAIHDQKAFFVARLKDNSAYEVLEELPLSKEATASGVVSDQRVRMGSAFTDGDLTAPVRRLVIVDPQAPDKGPVVILTNTELDGEIVSLLYRYRWQVELFFRWFKCILGCTHWLSQTRTGLTLQVYVALLASLLIRLWTGRKPTRRTFEMIQLYFMGWAQEHELVSHLDSLKKVS
jgi:hypothetical protein